MRLMKVLWPYFWPSGMKNRLRVLATWVCLVGSKASGIVAPLYIGLAVESLKDGDVDYYHIVMYAGLGFLAIAFKQLQNIIYLGVKQTVSHSHALSSRWVHTE